jgi:UDP-3-O-[3-hydroxymyristoyl] N-acetylglucosamine deacetylase
LLRALLANADAWQEVTFDDANVAPISYVDPVAVAV